MQEADAIAQDIDLDFLWECAPDDEFPFATLGADYFGDKFGAIERAALVLRMHGAPVYFRRKGRGQYQRAPQEQLQMALAALERKRQQALVQAGLRRGTEGGQAARSARRQGARPADQARQEFDRIQGARSAPRPRAAFRRRG